MIINGNLKFHTAGDGELQNLVIEKSAAAPGTGVVTGRLYYNTTSNTYCYYNGTAWLCFATGGNTGDLQTEIDNIETSLGTSVTSTGTWNGFTGTTYLNGATSITNALTLLDAAIVGKDTLAELNDVNLGSLVDNDILQYSAGSPAGWTNVAIGSASGIQPYDTGLVNLATGGTGLVAMDGDTVYWRTLTAPAAGITVSNGTGVGGDPTLALANDLAAVEGLNSTGFAVRTAADTWSERTIEGTTGNIVVTNGNGVTANPVVDLAALTIPTNAGTFLKFSYDTYGRVTAVNAVVASDITTLVDATYVNVGGDTMTGNLIMSSGATVTGLPSPTGDTDAANKAYVDALTAGLSWKNAVRVATTGNVDLTTGGLLTVDGVTVADGDRVLVLNQTAPAQNGIYIAHSGAWTRATDMDAAAEFDGAAVFVQEGSTYESSGWTQVNTITTVGTDAVSWSQFSGGAIYTWGTGLSSSGNTINVNLGAGIQEKPSDEVGVELYSPSTLALAFSTTGGVRSADQANPGTSDVLGLFVDATGGIKGGIGNAATALTLDFEALPTRLVGGEAVTTADYIAYFDASASDHVSATFLEIVQDLDVPYGISGSGIIVRTGADAYTTRTIGVYGAGAYDGLYITNGDGIGGAPTVGLDITGSPSLVGVGSPASVLTGDEEFVAYDPTQSVNGKTTLTEIVTYAQSTTDLTDLNDVVITSGADNEALIFNGTNWVNQKIYHLHTQGTAATSWTVTHDIGQQYCNVTVVDDTDNVIIPQSIVFDSTTQLTVTLNTSVAGKVIVMGVA